MQDKEPDRLSIRKSDLEHYKRLKQPDSLIAKKDNKHLFLLAMCIGYDSGSRIKISEWGKKEGFVRLEYLNEDEKSIINALSIAEEGDLEVLFDMKNVYSVAEEYAAGGISILLEMVISGGYGSFSKKLESKLLEQYDQIQQG